MTKSKKKKRNVMTPAITTMDAEDSRTIIDAVYLAWAMIHRDKRVLDPFEGTLSLERLNKVFAGFTGDELGE